MSPLQSEEIAMQADAEQTTAATSRAGTKARAASIHKARQSLAAAEQIRPATTGVAATVAAAEALIAAAGPSGWDAHLEARNLLVDFINAMAANLGGEADLTVLERAERLADEIECRLEQADGPAARRAQIQLAVRLNAEGFANADRFHDLAAAGVELEDEAGEPELTFAAARNRWKAIQAAFVAAEVASDEASEAEAVHDDLAGRFTHTHDAWRVARRVLLDTPAPHWAALSEKVRVILTHFDGLTDSARWSKAGRDLIEVANQIGSCAPKDAPLIEVMQARGFAEQVTYFLAHRPDGYANWACGGIAKLATEAELITTESRDLARARDDLRMMSGEIISAVWFSDTAKPRGCPVERLSDEWSDAIRVHDALDCSPRALSPDEDERLAETSDRMDAIRDEVLEQLPCSKAGAAFQLLVAASFIDHVRSGGSGPAQDAAEASIRKAIANTIRVLGLPFDYRAPQYFLGPHLDDLDGSRRSGPAQ